MKRTLATIAIACGVFSLATPVHAVAPQVEVPTVTVAASCDGLTVTTAGWPEGSDGIIGFGSAPPQGAPINMTWTYPMTDSPATIEGWSVQVRGPGQVEQAFYGTVDCRVDPPVDESTTTTTTVPQPPERAGMSPWVGVELAPPW